MNLDHREKVSSDPAKGWIAALFIYSLLMECVMYFCSYRKTPQIANLPFHTYFDKPNWFLFPVFFLLISIPLLLSWKPFLATWEKLPDTNVLRKEDQTASTSEKPVSASVEVTAYIQSKRWICVLLAVLLALIVNVFDMWELYRTNTVASYIAQLKLACKEPDFSTQWLFSGWKEKDNPCEIVRDSSIPDSKPGEPDTASVTAERVASHDTPAIRKIVIADQISGVPAVRAPRMHIMLIILVYAQQFFAVVFAALCFFQLIFHAILFALFNKLSFARNNKLVIGLNPESTIGEFGLEHWNHALNNIYWALSAALLVPIVSRLAQPDMKQLDMGQKLLNFFVPLLVLSPMVVTIICRQALLPSVWKQLKPQGPADPKLYFEQRLWPLDKNWASKLGIVIAFGLASYLLGIQISNIMKI